MHWRRDPRGTMLAFVDMEERIPKNHPLRAIKAVADESPRRDCLGSSTGCTRRWAGRQPDLHFQRAARRLPHGDEPDAGRSDTLTIGALSEHSKSCFCCRSRDFRVTPGVNGGHSLYGAYPASVHRSKMNHNTKVSILSGLVACFNGRQYHLRDVAGPVSRLRQFGCLLFASSG